jgi:hypothetical protein
MIATVAVTDKVSSEAIASTSSSSEKIESDVTLALNAILHVCQEKLGVDETLAIVEERTKLRESIATVRGVTKEGALLCSSPHGRIIIPSSLLNPKRNGGSIISSSSLQHQTQSKENSELASSLGDTYLVHAVSCFGEEASMLAVTAMLNHEDWQNSRRDKKVETWRRYRKPR